MLEVHVSGQAGHARSVPFLKARRLAGGVGSIQSVHAAPVAVNTV